MIVLGIETSCDDTSVALVNDKRQILANHVVGQELSHKEFGGVMPEVASRQHLIQLNRIVLKTLDETNLMNEIDAIAVTSGPGLIGSLIVGVMFAKGMSIGLKKPCININHLEGHALTPRLVKEDLKFPYLLLLLSGGNSQIILVNCPGNYEILGETLDDALGEAFDKVAKMLNLGYPGGPLIERIAKQGNPTAINFPKSLYGQQNCNFSFSGLKTSIMHYIANLKNRPISKFGNNHRILKNLGEKESTHEDNESTKSKLQSASEAEFQISSDNPNLLTQNQIADIAASFQFTVVSVLKDRLKQAIDNLRYRVENLVISGGVGANQYICCNIKEFIEKEYNMNLVSVPIKLCTDNAAMIAWAAIEHLFSKNFEYDKGLTFAPLARWPL